MKNNFVLWTLSLVLVFYSSKFSVNAQNVATPEIYDALQWRQIGPFRGGRSDGVSGVKGSDKNYYFASAGGGVWKTYDAGQSWKPVSDGFLEAQ